MKLPLLSTIAALALAATAARAGTWSTAAWTGDSTTYISSTQTLWAYHFGSTNPATVNGVSVPGIAGPTSASAQFDLTGTSAVFNNFTNNLTAQGGPGSAVMAADFIYSGNPAAITVKGLIAGNTYTVSFFGVDFANDTRLNRFTSGSDVLDVDEHLFGSANGVRVDYTFTASGATRAFTIAIQNPNFASWHLFGLALRLETEPTKVTNTQDAGTGSLRWALANAAGIAGADSVTFDSALSGGNIVTLSELTVADAGGVSIDASALAAPISISGGGAAHRLITHTAGSLTLRRLRLLNGNAGAAPNIGGAVRSAGAALAAFDCAFVNNQAGFTGGALSVATSGASSIEGCTFSGNTTTADGGSGGACAAIANAAALTVKKSTFHQNSSFASATGPSAGAILNTGSVALEHCTIADNTSGGSGVRGAVLLASTGGVSATITNCILADNPGGSDVNNATGSAANLTYAGANIVRTQANALFTGPAPLTGAPLLGSFGFNGGPTETRAPQFGSPAIDAATTIAGHGTDQRGFARPFDGDGNGSAAPDLGAVESYLPIVSNGNDSGSGSLRQAVADAATFPGADTIVFRSASFPTGGTVNLSASLAISAAGDAAGVSLATAVSGGNVDVAVNAGTFTWREGGVWTGGGRILLGATSGSAPATLEIADADGGTSLAAPVTVRAGSSGAKTLRDANANGLIPNTYAGGIALLAPATIDAAGNGRLDFSGDADLGANVLTVTGAGAGTIVFSGRVFRSDGIGKAQLVKSGAGSLQLAGSTDNTRLALTVNAGTAELSKTSSGSVHALGGGLAAADGPALTVAAGLTAICNGGDQIADSASVTMDGSLALFGDETFDALNGGGAVQAAFGSRALTVGAASGSGSFGGALKFALSLTKTGSGTQTLSGSSTATGALTVSGGVLNVTGSVATFSGVVVQSGATLAGPGTAPLTALESGAAVAPGDAAVAASIGTLAVSGTLTWNGGAAARFHLSTADNTSDRIALSGALTKGSAGAYRFDFQGTGLAGQTYTLGTFTSSTFTAADFSYTGLASGLVGTFTKTATSLTFTVSAFSPIVTSTADSGPGTLRRVLDDAAHIPGADTLTFPPALNGAIIALSSEIVIGDATGGVTLDAASLPAGITISGGGATRIFNVAGGSSLTLNALTLTAGNASSGGAVSNAGTLMLARCTLAKNAATTGGAIFNAGALTLTQCTLAENSATTGGAIANQGGAAFPMLTHCTLSRNTATSSGGAIVIRDHELTLANSIVAGNSAPSGPDISNLANPVFAAGVNIVGDPAGSGISAGPSVLIADPRLAPLADNGGPTRTMALRTGSPALDAATVLGGFVTDQRGFPRNRDGDAVAGSAPDIGAYEAQVAPSSGVGFNFVGGGAGGPGGTLAATDVAGVPEFAQANWNNLSTTIDGAAHDGTYAGGGPVPVVNASGVAFSPNLRLWWAADHLWNISNAPQSTPDRRLMNGYLDSNVGGPGHAATNLYASPASQPFLAVAALPAGTLGGYKAIVYTDGDASDRVGEYWLTSNRGANPASVGGELDLTPHVFVQDAANFSNTFTRVPATSTSNLGTSTPAGNYVVFEGLTEPGFIVRAEEAVTSSPINAVQIVRNEIIVVTTAADELDANGTLGAGISLREALRDAPEGAGILFDSTLNGATLALARGESVLAKDVTIDASNLSGGIAVDGSPGLNRIFTVSSGKIVTLVRLTLTGGNGAGALASGSGGAVLNQGWLTLAGCTVSGNSAAIEGGGIHTEGATARLGAVRCTFAGNTATGSGGGVNNSGDATTTLTHCTVSGNHAPGAGSEGGGIRRLSGVFKLANSIVAGNTATTLADVSGTIVQTGANLTSGNPLLAPLGTYGGPTMTMALLPGSPARNAAAGSATTSDQRGFPIVGVPDIGAYEAGTFLNFNAFIWESLPATATPAQHAAAFDFDGDGASNRDEWLALTDPAVSASILRVTQFTRTSPNVTVTFPSVIGRSYTFESSSDLVTWTPLAGAPVAGTGSALAIQLGPFPGATRLFIRVRTGP